MKSTIQMENTTASLLVSCPDKKGLVAKIANFIYSNGGNIIHADQHTDFERGLFLPRIEWHLDDFNLPRDLIAPAFSSIAQPLQAKWELHFSDSIPRIAIFVSKQEHCLLDLLWRHRAKELVAEIPVIISNHPNLKDITEQFDIDFHHIPITKATKIEQEKKQLELVDKYNIDLVVLAKYMQILSNDFVAQFPQIINIHHSFLPAFAGAKPYHAAFERGVKIIGATSHYVTEVLDAGPIIAQDVVTVSHSHAIKDFIAKGRDLEKIVLSRAVQLMWTERPWSIITKRLYFLKYILTTFSFLSLCSNFTSTIKTTL